MLLNDHRMTAAAILHGVPPIATISQREEKAA